MRRASCKHEHRVETRESRGDHLRSAAEAGEEVRLDEAGGDLDIGIDPRTIQVHRNIGRGRADVGERGSIAAVVVDHPIAAGDVRAEHLLQLGGSVGAVRPGRDQNGDVVRRDIGHLLEQRRQHLLPRLRAGDVADRNRDRLSPPEELPERRAAERRADRGQQRGARISDGGSEDRLDDDDPLLREIHLEPVDAIIQTHAHDRASLTIIICAP